MSQVITKLVYLSSLASLILGCHESKYIPAGQYLYVGSSVTVKSSPQTSKAQKRKLTAELKDLVRPTPNSQFLGIRFSLWLYNAVGTPTGKGLRYWLKNKVGEPPVLGVYSVFEKNRQVMQNRLENRGYFNGKVRLDTMTYSRKIKAAYGADTGPQYIVGQVIFQGDSTALNRQIQESMQATLLKSGEPYDLDRIKQERNRIDAWLKQRGYFYFNPNYLLVMADSTVGGLRVNMKILVKKTTPELAGESFRINDVTLFTNYQLSFDSSALSVDSSQINQASTKLFGYNIVDPEHKFKPQLFGRVLVFKPGEVYNRDLQDLSLKRLVSLGTFKFVKIRFDQVDSISRLLNVVYYLTPTEKKSIRFEASAFTQSDNANGAQVSVTWRNRNLFGGAELLTASIYGGLEKQNLGGGQSAISNTLGITLNLYLPHVIAPIHLGNSAAYMPKTRINAGYEYYDRTDQYILNSFKTGFGYAWKQNQNNEHQLNLITINLVNPTNINPAFQAQLDTNITLARSIERQFIIGPNYNYNSNTLLTPNARANNFYFNANLDLSANLIGLASGADIDKGQVKEIFNTPFSQYIRAELDFRHYLNFDKNTVLASRITGGVGFAYGNSSTMPFVKEFFAGGANDLRAFRSRSLGPGTYNAAAQPTSYVPDQPGDIKMEMNSELRFKIFSFIRWAFFVDAGNVWTLRQDTSRPGSQFSSQFLSQIAVGVGTGLRVDVSILILRLDVGIPVREPYLSPGSRWLFDPANAVWNFAIGYPF
jgi:outer membrane protein insertion porin family